jgi:hypothetical protein
MTNLKLNFETQFLLCKRYAATIYKISSQLFPKFERFHKTKLSKLHISYDPGLMGWRNIGKGQPYS